MSAGEAYVPPTDREVLVMALTGSSDPLPTNPTEIVTLALELAVAEASSLVGEHDDEESLRARSLAGRLRALRWYISEVGDWTKGGAS